MTEGGSPLRDRSAPLCPLPAQGQSFGISPRRAGGDGICRSVQQDSQQTAEFPRSLLRQAVLTIERRVARRVKFAL